MKLNEQVIIIGKSVCLVPYSRHHVPKYHAWMQNDELLEATASEPLSINEEYSMQISWGTDEDKLTFIVLEGNTIPQSVEEEINRMIGDINLFFLFAADIAEINIMVAEQDRQRSGFGSEILSLMLNYSVHHLNISKFSAKISNNNYKSLNFFKKNNFTQESVSNVFQETTFELPACQVAKISFIEAEYPFFNHESSS